MKGQNIATDIISLAISVIKEKKAVVISGLTVQI